MTLFPTALGIALISFADTSVISHSFAARRGERVDADHELAALGVVNVAAGLVGGFASSGSATRTPVAESAGSRTQVTGLVGAGAILLLLVAVPGLLAPVPTAALAAVVISAVLSLFDVEGLRRLWRQRRSELGLALVAFLDRRPLRRAARASPRRSGCRSSTSSGTPGDPHDAVLGRVANYKGYHDIGRHPEARLVPGADPLPLGRAALLRQRRALPRARRSRPSTHAPPPTRWLAVASEPMTDIDTTAADMLEELITELARRGVELHFAELKGHVKDRLQVYGIYEPAGRRPLPPDDRQRGQGLPGDAIPTWRGGTGRTSCGSPAAAAGGPRPRPPGSGSAIGRPDRVSTAGLAGAAPRRCPVRGPPAGAPPGRPSATPGPPAASADQARRVSRTSQAWTRPAGEA